MIRRRMTRLSPWAAPVLGGLLFAGDLPSAAASCGDHVHILPPGQTAPDADPATTPAKPCSGPGCREAPPAPMPAPPPAPTTASAHDVILTILPPPAPPGAGLVRVEYVLSPCRVATDVFHPPRA